MSQEKKHLPPRNSPWLNIREAAEYLPFRSKSPRTRQRHVAQLVEQGHLRAYTLDPSRKNIPRNFCFNIKDLDRAIRLVFNEMNRVMAKVDKAIQRMNEDQYSSFHRSNQL